MSDDAEFSLFQARGKVFVPIPSDSSDAYRLYETNPVFTEAVDVTTDTTNLALRSVLVSGPNCLEIEKERLGLLG